MKNKYTQSEYFRQQQLQRVKNKSKEQRNIWFEDKLQEELKLLKNKRGKSKEYAAERYSTAREYVV